MVRGGAVEVSDYERKRQETIAKNQALLRNLALEAASTGLAPSSKPARSSTGSTDKKKKKPAPKKVKEEVQPLRKSSRLRGVVADSEVAKRKAEEQHEAFKEAERAKRQRISGDLQLGDIVTGGQWDQSGNFLTGVGPARPYERTFKLEDVEETGDKEIKALRKRMNALELWDGATPNKIKITPERIYSMGFHPTRDKALVFAGDKMGSLGLFDASQTGPTPNEVKKEVEDDEDEEEDFEPAITTFKLHTRTISAFQFSPTDSNALFSASYDSSIRKLDLVKGVAVEVYAPSDAGVDEPIAGVQIAKDDPNVLYFSTLDGVFGIHDVRTKGTDGTQKFQLSEKKIGGFGLHPTAPHLVATASLDRTLKLWDLRKISGKGSARLPALIGEHMNKLSVSAANWNERGQVATSSYDDTIKVYDFSACASDKWKVGSGLSDEDMEPKTIIPHNNQTGRWVTILKPQWQAQPEDGIQRFVIGNMNRFVDIYASTGDQLAQLGGGEFITAVPAVAQFHPSMDWVAAGTASGKLCLWM
ncbi:WD repeat-containing protein [Rhizodiscina lignyota]|uniref:DNA damage-binding protein CMR1 n=1 Tax=Rhizodiscina lignyota TaxID=1504668 RepID=A0A9P4IKQ6_9PEZI|nr:WD repeat-containing protein [Rhizodiscina lignyota]